MKSIKFLSVIAKNVENNEYYNKEYILIEKINEIEGEKIK